MAKPWARLEQNYINHPKFLALDASSICLWHEGKNYCDMHQTDGLIPREALKTFRFAGRRQVDALIVSCGPKPSGEPWAPLWETSGTLGFKMHDYLDHNDCRDAVLARIEDADEQKEHRRLKNRERQAAFRQRRQAAINEAGLVIQPRDSSDVIDYAAIIERDGMTCHICKKPVARVDLDFDHIVPVAAGGPHSAANIAVSHASCNRGKRAVTVTARNGSLTAVTSTPTETETETPTKEQERETRNATSALRPSRADGRSDGITAGSLPKDHLGHVACNDTWTVCVPANVHAKLKNSLAGRYVGDRDKADAALREWYRTVFLTLPADFVMPDAFRFWQARFDSELATPTPAVSKGKPEPVFTVPDAAETKRRLQENR